MPVLNSTFSAAELMITAMASEIVDGDCLAQGIGTTLPACAYYLAQATHAPNCMFLYSAGGTFAQTRAPLTLSRMEHVALSKPIRLVSYTEIVCGLLPGLRFKEFSRPAQVDEFGNTNNVVVTTPSGKTLRLPGAGGIPDFSAYESHESFLYVPRQDVQTLVNRVEFCSGAGNPTDKNRSASILRRTGRGTRRLVTDLAVIEFTAEGAKLVSLHPGVSPEEVIARCAFPLQRPSRLPETAHPTREQLELIRVDIDPKGIRDLELLPGRGRQMRIREVLALEKAEVSEVLL